MLCAVGNARLGFTCTLYHMENTMHDLGIIPVCKHTHHLHVASFTCNEKGKLANTFPVMHLQQDGRYIPMVLERAREGEKQLCRGRGNAMGLSNIAVAPSPSQAMMRWGEINPNKIVLCSCTPQEGREGVPPTLLA